jgi:hypothetical protein
VIIVPRALHIRRLFRVATSDRLSTSRNSISTNDEAGGNDSHPDKLGGELS